MKHKTKLTSLRPSAGFPASLEPFKALYEAMEEGVLMLDRKFNIIYFNKKAARLVKDASLYTCHEGANIMHMLPEELHEPQGVFLNRMLEGETIRYNLELPGDKNALRCKGVPLLNRGRIAALCILLEDIPQEKLAVSPVEESEQEQQSRLLFEDFMQNCPIVGWITDENALIRYMNPTYLRTYGFTEQDCGKSIYDLFPEQLAVDFHLNNMEVIRSGKPIEIIETALLSSGAEQVLRVYKFPLRFNGVMMVAGWAMDITEQAHFQRQLVHSVERYHYVNEATSDSIYDWNIAERRIYKGSGFETLFGSKDKEMSILERLRRIHPDDRDRVKDVYFSSLRDEHAEKWSVEFRWKAADGTYRHVLDKALIKRDDKEAVRVIGAFRDITEQKELQEKVVEKEKLKKREIVRSIIEAQEKERRKLSLELHDNVNQILASCKLMLEVAQEHKDTAHMFIEKVYKDIQTVIREVRKISQDLNPSAVEDIGLVEAIIEMVDKINLSDKLHISFTCRGLDNSSRMQEEDRIAVYRIIQEQVNNILKHSNATKASVKLTLKNSKLRLVIQDNGIGFNMVSVKKGLGLRNIRHRVDYYHGKVKFVSPKDKGCRMTVELNLE
ncbi:MAG TPA: PAS domain S-box protein [Flavisolibacter sp.]